MKKTDSGRGVILTTYIHIIKKHPYFKKCKQNMLNKV